MGGGGWLEQLGIRLSQLPTKLKLNLKLKLSLAIQKKVKQAGTELCQAQHRLGAQPLF